MSKDHKTTEFSLHISRSRMRRYLHGQLNQKEVAEVETHLKHCIHCSEAIIQYITVEEPEHYKTYMKSLKGKIIESAKPKGPRFSSVQVKTMRAAAAVVILLSFSFFAFENLIDKDFSLVTQPQQEEASFVRKSVFPGDKQQGKQAKAKPQQKESMPEESTAKEVEKQPEVQVADATPKKKPSPKPTPQAKPKKEVKEEKKPATETSSTPQVAAQREDDQQKDIKTEKKPETVAAVEKTEPVIQSEESTEKEEVKVPAITPIEKIEVGNEATNLQEEKNKQVVPSASVGQLRQQ